MLLAQEYAPDLTQLKDKFMGTPLGLLYQGNVPGAINKLGTDAQARVQAMINPESALQTGFDFMGGGLLGTFVGKGSKLWKQADYNKALKLEKEGVTPEQIWQETGTAKFADGQWRQEISDKGAQIKADFKVPGGYYEARNLGEFIDHPQLFESYPNAKNIDISQPSVNTIFNKDMTGASFSPKSYDRVKGIEYPDRITIYPDRLTYPLQTKSSLLHENQHYIQEAENFARGGNPETVVTTLEDLAKQKRNEARKMFDLSSNLDPLDSKIIKPGARTKGLKLEEEARALDDAALKAYLSDEQKFNMYKKMAGEAEARLTQRRMSLTDAERRANFPYSYKTDYGLDYPMEELFVQGILK
jgi:hypothetical protein